MFCCKADKIKGLSKEDILIKDQNTALKDSSEDKVTIVYDRFGPTIAEVLQEALVESGLPCKFKKILTSPFSEGDQIACFADIDGRHNKEVFKKTVNEWAGTVLMLGMELFPDSYNWGPEALMEQSGFKEFMDKNNAFILLTKNEYDELCSKKVPTRLAELLQR